MESTFICGNLLELLLGVNLVELLWGHSGGVHVKDVQGSGEALLVDGLSLGNLVVVDGGSAGGPGGAENALRLAVQQTKVGGGGVGGEEKDGFLDGWVRKRDLNDDNGAHW